MEAEKIESKSVAMKAEKECLTEINEALKKHDCQLEVDFKKGDALGKPVLVYTPIVVYKGESKP